MSSSLQNDLNLTDFSPAAMKAYFEHSAQASVQLLNTNLKNVYLGRFAGWSQMVTAGQIDNSNPPKPPVAYVVTYDALGLAFAELGTEPVIPMPPIPPNPRTVTKVPNHIHVLKNIDNGVGKWFVAGEDDTLPGGEQTPPMASDDGWFGVFEKYPAPVGQGWYVKKA